MASTVRAVVHDLGLGFELPATSLIEPFLADIAVAPRTSLETLFSISAFPAEPDSGSERGNIRD